MPTILIAILLAAATYFAFPRHKSRVLISVAVFGASILLLPLVTDQMTSLVPAPAPDMTNA